ncbi:hypothetical protein GCM10008967_28170 [Bacillus carboniphilus]|uniref:Uncharacterized protein n=1 Tax=Bacillus carboniphilus TaxID=86663 RepID=A0ABN0WGQ4_9BACI
MKKLFLTLVILLGFLFQITPTSATTIQEVEYPNNQGKSFISEDEFYNQLDKDMYQEYKNAAYSIRRKIPYKEVPDAELSFNRKTKNNCQDKMSLQTPHIHPERQVYFFASFSQNEKEEFHKFIVVDAETKTRLLEGNSFHRYENPYRN